MKNFSFLLLASSLFASQFAAAQCTPNSTYAGQPAGIYPGTSVNLPVVALPEAYSTSLTINTEVDTAISVNVGGTPTNAIAYIGAMRVNAVNGLPAGFSWITNQPEWNNGGAAPNFTPVQGCVSILASGSTVQELMQLNPLGASFPLEIVIDAKISSTNNALFNFVVSNSWLSDLSATVPGAGPQTVTGYILTIGPSGSSQCTPEILYVGQAPGVYPDVSINLPSINTPEAYFTSLTLNTLADTNVIVDFQGTPINVNAFIDATRINSITGLPSGFSWSTNEPVWNNVGAAPSFIPVQGCVSISAQASAVQQLLQDYPAGASFPLEITIDSRINSTDNLLFNSIASNAWLSDLSGTIPIASPQIITGYILTVEPSITGQNHPNIPNQSIYPNPSNGFLTIISKGNSTLYPSAFTLLNYAGQEVFRKSISQGTETISLPDILTSGVYLARVVDSMGRRILTERVVLSK